MLDSMLQKKTGKKGKKAQGKKAQGKKAKGQKADKQKPGHGTSAKAKQTKKETQQKTENERPFGCSKCRGLAGCTRSCLKSNTKPLEKPYKQVKKQKC